MMIANPTAASAAATAITMKTNNWPVTLLCSRENAISERLTALSINSTHINSDMTLRCMSTPITPIVNKTALSARYHEIGTMFQYSPLTESSGDLLFVFFFLFLFLLRDQGFLDAFYVFLLVAAREPHRADNRHQDQDRRRFKRDHVIREHPLCDAFNRAASASHNLLRRLVDIPDDGHDFGEQRQEKRRGQPFQIFLFVDPGLFFAH